MEGQEPNVFRVVEQWQLLDVELFRLINGVWTHPLLDRFMAFICDFGLWIWPLGIAGLVLAWKGRAKERIFLVVLALTILIGDGLIIQGIREIVNRGRPWQTLDSVRFVDMKGVEIREPGPFEKGRSMPSGHVCNNTALVVLVLLFYGIRCWPLLMWIGLMGYARIYTGSHFPSDVLISVPLAMAYTYLIYCVAAYFWRRYVAQKWPHLHQHAPELFRAS